MLRSPEIVGSDLQRLEKYHDRKTRVKEVASNGNIPSAANPKKNLPKTTLDQIELLEEVIDPQAIEKDIDHLNELAEKESHAEDLRLAFQEKIKSSLNQVVQRNANRKAFKGKVDKKINLAKDPLEFVHDIFNDPYRKVFEVFSFKGSKGPEAFIQPAEYALLASRGISMIGDGASLIVQGIQYKTAKNLLKEIQESHNQLPTDEMAFKIEALEQFLKQQRIDIKQRLVTFSAAFGATAIMSLKNAKKVIEPLLPGFGTTIGFVTPFIEIAWKSIGVYRAREAKKTYAAYIALDGLGKKTADKPIDELQEQNRAKGLLLKRQERVILKRISYEELKIKIREEMKEKSVTFKQAENESEKDYKERIYQRAISSIYAEIYPSNEEQYIEDAQETMSIMTRNALVTLSQKKIKHEKKFINFNRISSSLALSFSSLSVAIMLVLKILVVVGVLSLTAAQLAVPGLGFFVLGLILTTAGLIYLKKHKPNIFKCYLQGTTFALTFTKIAAKIRSIQLHNKTKAVLKLETTSARLEQLDGAIKKQKKLDLILADPAWKKDLEKLQKETKKHVENFETLNKEEQIKTLRERISFKKSEIEEKKKKAEKQEALAQKKSDSWTGEKGIVTKLENKLKEAANKDFARSVRLKTTAKLENSPPQILNIPEVLAESLTNSDILYDPSLQKFIKDKWGIDIQKVLVEGEQIDTLKLQSLVGDYLKMDESELLGFIKSKLNAIDWNKTA